MWREVRKLAHCIRCGRLSKRHSVKKKVVHTENGKEELTVSKHYCPSCDKHFTNPDGEKHAPLRRNVSWGLLHRALQLAECGTLEQTCSALKKETGYNLSQTTLHDWVSEKDALLKRMNEVLSMGKET